MPNMLNFRPPGIISPNCKPEEAIWAGDPTRGTHPYSDLPWCWPFTRVTGIGQWGHRSRQVSSGKFRWCYIP